MDTSRCPLCGESNACAMADPATAGGPCWCTAATISDDVLDRVPEEARRKACICPRCAQTAAGDARTADDRGAMAAPAPGSMPDPPRVHVLPEHRCPSGGDMPLAGLAIRVDELARRVGIPLQEWEEDGLGTMRGAVCRLPSGRVVLVRELAHAVRHLGTAGPEISVDAGELAVEGVDALVAEVRAAFGLEPEELDWVQPAEASDQAAEMLARWREIVRRREAAAATKRGTT